MPTNIIPRKQLIPITEKKKKFIKWVDFSIPAVMEKALNADINSQKVNLKLTG